MVMVVWVSITAQEAPLYRPGVQGLASLAQDEVALAPEPAKTHVTSTSLPATSPVIFHFPLTSSAKATPETRNAAAAIDRLVHHSVIIELNLPSYRVEQAKKAKQGRPAEAGESASGPEPGKA